MSILYTAKVSSERVECENMIHLKKWWEKRNNSIRNEVRNSLGNFDGDLCKHLRCVPID